MPYRWALYEFQPQTAFGRVYQPDTGHIHTRATMNQDRSSQAKVQDNRVMPTVDIASEFELPLPSAAALASHPRLDVDNA
jgi:hypothetical protein